VRDARAPAARKDGVTRTWRAANGVTVLISAKFSLILAMLMVTLLFRTPAGMFLSSSLDWFFIFLSFNHPCMLSGREQLSVVLEQNLYSLGT